MTAKTSLRAVPDSKAKTAPKRAPKAPVKPPTVSEAATKGSTRDLLVAMRDRIAKAVENEKTAAKDLAALSNRLMQIVRDIEAIDAREGQEDADRANDVEDGKFDASAV